MSDEHTNASSSSLSVRRAAILADIALAETAVKNARIQRLRLNKVLNSTAPIMALPLNVFSEILFLAIHEQFVEVTKPSFNGRPPPGRLPFRLATVCKSWREFVLNTPQLWTLITLTYDNTNATHLNAVLKVWLKRSGSCQIDIHLHHWGPSRPNPTTAYSLLLKESARWKSFNSFTFSNIMDFTAHQFPNLSSLTIRRAPGYDDDFIDEQSDIDRWRIFVHAKIRHLQLVEVTPLCWKFDFTALASFTGKMRRFGALMHVLQSAPSLEECTVCLRVERPHSRMPDPVTMRELVKLDISGDVIRILSSITVPRLSHLKIDISPTYGQVMISHIVSVLSRNIQRSGCQLRTLEFVLADSCDGSYIPDLNNLLPHVQSLETFGVVLQDDLSMDDQLLTQILSLPNLTSVNVTGKIEFQPNTFLIMIRPSEHASTTINQAPHLRRISVHYTNQSWISTINPNVLCDFFQELRDLKSRSIEVDFKYIER